MPGRDKPLITRNGIPDPQAYNPQTGQWESFIGVSWGKTAGGLYVPIRVDDQGRQEVTLSNPIVELATGSNIAVTAGSTVTLYENTTKQYPARSIRAAVSGFSNFNKAELAIRFWGQASRMSSYAYALRSEVVEANAPYIQASTECEVYGGYCRVTLTNLMTTDGTLASAIVLGVI